MANEIFVSYANGDKDFALRLKKAFNEVKIEPWINLNELNQFSGTDFQRGINIADAFIPLISNEYLADNFFESQLISAVNSKKQIIPLFINNNKDLLNSFEKKIPQLTETKQFTLNSNPENFDEVFNSILQNLNISDYNNCEVYISYSVKDKYFTDKLFVDLNKNKINFSAENSLFDLEKSHTVIFVLNLDFNSENLKSEIEIALKHNKRIILLKLNKSVQIPELLKNSEIIDFSDENNFSQNFSTFLNLFDTDIDYYRFHTYLQNKIYSSWLQKGKPDSKLLNGKELERAEKWLKQSKTKKFKPTQLQEIYINASSVFVENELNKKQKEKIIITPVLEEDDPELIEEKLLNQTKANPYDIDSWRELSFLYVENERYNEAIEISIKALEIDDDFDILLNLAVAYYASNKIKNSLIEFKKAMDWIEEIEDIEEIRKALDQAYEINPDSNAVENLYDELEILEKEF